MYETSIVYDWLEAVRTREPRMSLTKQMGEAWGFRALFEGYYMELPFLENPNIFHLEHTIEIDDLTLFGMPPEDVAEALGLFGRCIGMKKALRYADALAEAEYLKTTAFFSRTPIWEMELQYFVNLLKEEMHGVLTPKERASNCWQIIAQGKIDCLVIGNERGAAWREAEGIKYLEVAGAHQDAQWTKAKLREKGKQLHWNHLAEKCMEGFLPKTFKLPLGVVKETIAAIEDLRKASAMLPHSEACKMAVKYYESTGQTEAANAILKIWNSTYEGVEAP